MLFNEYFERAVLKQETQGGEGMQQLTWNRIDTVFLLSTGVAYTYRMLNEPRWCRFLMTFGECALWLKVLYFCRINQKTGTLVNALIGTLGTMWRFLLVLSIVVLGYGFAMQGLMFPAGRRIDEHIWAIMYDAFVKPFFQMFGELFLEDIEEPDDVVCPAHSFVLEGFRHPAPMVVGQEK